FDDDRLRFRTNVRRIASWLQLEAGDAAELRTLDLRVQMAEHENVAVFGVLGMEGEGGDPALHVQEQVLLTGRVTRAEAVDFSWRVLGHHEAIRRRILRDEYGLLESELVEGASQPVLR